MTLTPGDSSRSGARTLARFRASSGSASSSETTTGGRWDKLCSSLLQEGLPQDQGKKIKAEVREFNFSQQYIFGVFDSFCNRLNNLLDMFDNIGIFTQLFDTKLEALLSDEVLITERIAFEQVVVKITLLFFLSYRLSPSSKCESTTS